MWREFVDMIKRESSPDIVKNLKISFEGLQDKEKTIFLDIACFLRGEGKDKTIEILESYDLGARIRLHSLIGKSLVFISIYGTIQMHDLIQEMGRYIVKMQKDSGQPSRLWDVKDFEDVMEDNMGAMAVEALWFPYPGKLRFSKEAMKNMQRLRILCIQYYPWKFLPQCDTPNGSIEYRPINLCYFVWHNYPWKLLPENFNPRRLVHLDLQGSELHHLWNETKQLPSLRRLDLSYSESLKRTPDFKGMPNLEYLSLCGCRSLEEVHHSLGGSKKLIELSLFDCESLEKFPYVNVESLESLNLISCYSLEKFPEILGIMKPELDIEMLCSGIRELPLSIFDHQPHLKELDLRDMENLVSLSSSICKLKGLVKLVVTGCSKLENLPEEIGDLENLEHLDARCTLISRPPSSIVRLNKLKFLTFETKISEDGVYFVFPQVSEGLFSLVHLNLSYCNVIDGGIPEDIGSLSSLKELNLRGNNFEHLPQSIAQLGVLRFLDLSNCMRLTQLPEFPQQLDTIFADWSNDSICNSLFQNISSLHHDISASHSLSLRVFTSWWGNIPSWFHHQGMGLHVSVNLPENWYVSDKFLGFAVCYYGELIDDITADLIPLCDDGMSSMTQKLALYNRSEHINEDSIHFLLIPLGCLWDASNANGKTPNDSRCIRLYSPGETDDFGEIDDFEETDDFGEINEYGETDDFGETDDIGEITKYGETDDIGEINKYGETDDFGEIYTFGVRLLYKDEASLHTGIRKSR